MKQGMALKWRPSYPDPIVWVSVAEIDESWCQDKTYYVGRSASGTGNGCRTKYDRFGKWLNREEAIVMPHLALSREGHIAFSDGRHRFAWLRDHGVEAIPVTVSPEIEMEVSRRFGTKLRKSIVFVSS